MPLLGYGVFVYFKAMVPGRSFVLQDEPYTHECMSCTNWIQLVIFLKKDMKLGGRNRCDMWEELAGGGEE